MEQFVAIKFFVSHLCLMGFAFCANWMSPFFILGVSVIFVFYHLYGNCCKSYINAKSTDPDQMMHSAGSDLGLHCLPITLDFLNMEFSFKYM